MPQELVAPDEFLTRLTAAFETKSTVWLTSKRFTQDGDDTAMAADDTEYEVLLRCTQNDTKFSTRIPASSLPTFTATYGALLKTSMAGRMRKRDKKKERARADAAEKRRRELYVDVDLSGTDGKRGAGRRKRQRKVAAQRKKESERERLEAREAARAAATPADD